MPAIGPKTIEGAIDAQLRGVAIASGQVLLLEREVCAREADAAGLFVAGFAYPGLPG
jgi:UDP-2,3-diacylglucosamine hydrolase